MGKKLTAKEKLEENKHLVNRFEGCWSAVCKSRGEIKLVKEFQFYSERRWSADYANPDAKVLIEIEGGLAHGRHTSPGGYAADCEKYNAAALLGYSVFRLVAIKSSGLDMISDYYVEFIYDFIAKRLANAKTL